MAKYVKRKPHFTVNDVALSAYIRSDDVAFAVDAVDSTTSDNTATERVYLPGLKGTTMSFTFAQDFTAAKVDATLWAIWDGDAAVTFIYKPDGDTTAVTNPKFTGSCILTDYQVSSGSIGSLAEITANFTVSTAVERATSD